VTAQELKAAEMIKLPVVLSEHLTWQQAVDAAIARQAELEVVARADADYIRPIVLFQAQDKGQEANVAVLKAYLLDNGIAENRIRIATGDQRELDAVNLFDPACPVDFIITVEALKEGWDCSFAYVFCSLANVGSATDAEQLLGRVLRMPYARRRKDDRLNRAYAHLASPRFADAAMALRDRMVAMGFDESEAEANILAPQGELEGCSPINAAPAPFVRVGLARWR
jgi:type III restriction enzyme